MLSLMCIWQAFWVQWILSLDPLRLSKLSPASYRGVGFLRCVFTAKDIYAHLNAIFQKGKS